MIPVRAAAVRSTRNAASPKRRRPRANHRQGPGRAHGTRRNPARGASRACLSRRYCAPVACAELVARESGYLSTSCQSGRTSAPRRPQAAQRTSAQFRTAGRHRPSDRHRGTSSGCTDSRCNDQHAAHACGAHLGKGDLLGGDRHSKTLKRYATATGTCGVPCCDRNLISVIER
jgi:hypothetical protein